MVGEAPQPPTTVGLQVPNDRVSVARGAKPEGPRLLSSPSRQQPSDDGSKVASAAQKCRRAFRGRLGRICVVGIDRPPAPDHVTIRQVDRRGGRCEVTWPFGAVLTGGRRVELVRLACGDGFSAPRGRPGA